MADQEITTKQRLRYRSTEKHSQPWQPGRKGSLCPSEIDVLKVGELLDQSIEFDNRRFAAYQGKSFVGQCSGGVWHGYPVGWVEVPEPVRREFVASGTVRRSDQRKHWTRHYDEP